MKGILTLHYLSVFIILSFVRCVEPHAVNKSEREYVYLRWIGDIEHNAILDDPNFNICTGEDEVLQYFNVGEGPVYVGEKSSLLSTFKRTYSPVIGKDQNGLIRIRFIVNCHGQAGRFRVLQGDSNYKETEFDEEIVSQLTEITKGIEAWVVLQENDQPVDYYYYLIFKLIDGRITEILP